LRAAASHLIGLGQQRHFAAADAIATCTAGVVAGSCVGVRTMKRPSVRKCGLSAVAEHMQLRSDLLSPMRAVSFVLHTASLGRQASLQSVVNVTRVKLLAGGEMS